MSNPRKNVITGSTRRVSDLIQEYEHPEQYNEVKEGQARINRINARGEIERENSNTEEFNPNRVRALIHRNVRENVMNSDREILMPLVSERFALNPQPLQPPQSQQQVNDDYLYALSLASERELKKIRERNSSKEPQQNRGANKWERNFTTDSSESRPNEKIMEEEVIFMEPSSANANQKTRQEQEEEDHQFALSLASKRELKELEKMRESLSANVKERRIKQDESHIANSQSASPVNHRQTSDFNSGNNNKTSVDSSASPLAINFFFQPTQQPGKFNLLVIDPAGQEHSKEIDLSPAEQRDSDYQCALVLNLLDNIRSENIRRPR